MESQNTKKASSENNKLDKKISLRHNISSDQFKGKVFEVIKDDDEDNNGDKKTPIPHISSSNASFNITTPHKTRVKVRIMNKSINLLRDDHMFTRSPNILRRKMRPPLKKNKVRLHASTLENGENEVVATVVDNNESEDDSVKAEPFNDKIEETNRLNTNIARNLIPEKRILLHEGPEPTLPLGWTIKHYKRTTGLRHTDRYWFSPTLKKKFRSLAQVTRFLEFLTKVNGDEAKAWEHFRTSPPGPDEIRSRSRVRQPSLSGEVKVRKEIYSTSTSNSTRDVIRRIPLLTSPGLLLNPPPCLVIQKGGDCNSDKDIALNTILKKSSGLSSFKLNAKRLMTPSDVFRQTCLFAGESCALKKKRCVGASYCRTVNDMFDSDIGLEEMEQDLVLLDLWNHKAVIENDIRRTRLFSKALYDELKKYINRKFPDFVPNPCSTVAFDVKPLPFLDMITNSLTVSLPESYVQKKQTYIDSVLNREWQLNLSRTQAQKNVDAMNDYEKAMSNWMDLKEELELTVNGSDSSWEDRLGPKPEVPKSPSYIDIPPIPNVPTCSLDDIINSKHDTKLCRILESKRYLVEHLDADFFLPPEGRYVGLLSNDIVDTQFVGPNAPGILNATFTSGTGLATSYVGTLSGGTFHGLTVKEDLVEKRSSSYCEEDSSKKRRLTCRRTSKRSVDTYIAPFINFSSPTLHDSTVEGYNGDVAAITLDGLAYQSENETYTKRSFSHLQKVMEKQDETHLVQMRDSIIRGAVYSCRIGAHSGFFLLATGEEYSDVSRAFCTYGNIRPCLRCNYNKRGAFYCRLQRKHRHLDYDGGDSASVLSPFFHMTLEELIPNISRKRPKL